MPALPNWLNELNPQQAAIVTHTHPHVLVLAGAGSGKTRVLIHRIAWLLQLDHIHESEMLAVTFSNKAATELKHRLSHLLGTAKAPPWIGTFHGLSYRILRRHTIAAGLPENFQILDADDQMRLVKRLMKSLNLSEQRWPPRRVLTSILGKKEQGIAPQISGVRDPLQQVYHAYQQVCHRSGLLDFPELLLRTLRLWQKDPSLLQRYQTQFRHLFVDEFQDTDSLQYQWLKRLAGEKASLFAVGDDDQCIYGWRGAQVENLSTFTTEFAGTQLLRLEQNYRSTPEILQAANALIAQNSHRFGKTLWSNRPSGAKISLYAASSELDEAYYVARQIEDFHQLGIAFLNIAIFYRNNAQSRAIEEALIQIRLPYQIYGGLRFFDRQEIKDILAYLRLTLNPHDDGAFERILNVPTRGIGVKGLEHLRQHALQHHESLWSAALQLLNLEKSSRFLTPLRKFISLIEQLREQTASLPLHENFKLLIEATGLWQHYEKLGQADPAICGSKLDNLAELINAAEQFQTTYDLSEREDTYSCAHQFLTHLALDPSYSEQEQGEAESRLKAGKVQLMTLHAAKGLEFDYVFIVGLEEGIFPSEASKSEMGRLEEERRLAYVGVTRAKVKLNLSYSRRRQWYGRICHNEPSRFLQEIPKNLLDSSLEFQKASFYPRPSSPQSDSLAKPRLGLASLCEGSFQTGTQINHAVFGNGVVKKVVGEGAEEKIQVQFLGGAEKWLLVQMAPIKRIV